MKITADSGCYLTEVAEVAPDKRTFRNMVIVATVEEAAGWKQITEQEKAALESQGAIFGSQDVTPEYLGRVDTLLTGIAERINDTPMTAAQSLKNKKYYPQRKDIIGKQVDTGFRFNEGETMYEVLQPHTLSAEWMPGQGTESLYKVCTKGNTIPTRMYCTSVSATAAWGFRSPLPTWYPADMWKSLTNKIKISWKKN